jgi:hypothetical protein
MKNANVLAVCASRNANNAARCASPAHGRNNSAGV